MIRLGLLFMIFTLNCNSQVLLNGDLYLYRKDIIEHLKNYDEIIEKSKSDSIFFPLLYSRTICKISRKVCYYEVGLTRSHSNKFLAILDNGRFILLPTSNFSDEFEKFIIPLRHIRMRKNKTYDLLTAIRLLYNYNSNPPWK